MAMTQDTGAGLDPHATFVPENIRIPVDPLLRVQGYRDMERVRPQVREAAQETAAKAEAVVAPIAYLRRARVAVCADGVLTLEPGAVFHSAEVTKVLAGCRDVIATIVTVGPGIDEELQRCIQEDDILTALFLETAGWIAMEQATKAMRGHLTGIARDGGCRLSRRLAPGYSDWALDEQAAMFSLFDGIELPVRLLDSSVMLPKMSRSGLYGLLPRR